MQQEHAKLAAHHWKWLLELPTYNAEREKQINTFFKNHKTYQAVAFYDAEGSLVRYFESPFSPLYAAQQIPAQVTPLSRRVTFSLNHHEDVKPKSKKTDIHYALQIGMPVKWENTTNSIETLVFIKKFPYLDNLLTERAKSFQQGFVIVDKNGVIIAGPSKLVNQQLSKPDLKLYLSLKDGIAQEFSTPKPLYFDGKSTEEVESPKVEKVFIKIPQLSWGIIIESPYQIQRHFILKARTQSVALVFLCIILIVILGVFYSGGINRNFRQLIKGIKALAEGHYSRKIRLITKSWTPYEIVYLTAEFNRMATKISSAWSSIQKLNQELVYKNQQDLFIAQATQRLHSSLEPQIVYETATQILYERPNILGAILYMKNANERFEPVSQSVHGLFYSNDNLTLPHDSAPLFHYCLRINKPVTPPEDTFSELSASTFAEIHPICYQETPLGVLVLIKSAKTPDIFDYQFDDALVLSLICSQIGVAIHQATQWQQLQNANIQLSQLDELKSNLIDTVSHELRTPLTNIKGYTSRLIRYENSLDAETKVKSLKVIKQQADRLGRLVEDLLVIPDLERKEGIRVFPDRVDIQDLIYRCVSFVQEKADREIRIAEYPETLDVLVDPDRMEQVVLNLLDNAIKYSFEDSVIDIKIQMSKRPGMAQIQVFNPCDPIPSEEIPQLFSKFKRLDERLTRTTRGTGLGLFITKGLIEAMGGLITLDGSHGFLATLDIPLYSSTPKSLPLEQDQATSVSPH